ncbi:molybdenum cofactor biosynthesis protein MoaE [Paenarthrobacter sp. Z7-10]|uniref:molybdenum cofactor biosynthesis protein MoaE n=1 Tax=Paenarthrobacter sp. Z7-10 TaxID=2787635 RepID=UPI0022A8EF33|nr:molybdenum cofactor biosynthesis protein MoaE [Paenarthrobacter sp. Z7-10]MCZ2403579.1 molybdenum cofactor biosynthesis protein MoaE [Paenarthrobacter sp. Z7-10]
MSTEILSARLSAEPITVQQAIDAVDAADCGAVVSFSGVVRNHDGGRDVARLSYSGHPTAERVMTDVVASVLADFSAGAGGRGKGAGGESGDDSGDGDDGGPSGAGDDGGPSGDAASPPATLRVWAAHRVGPLEIGDAALVCAVAAPHRQLAFAACAELVDRIKDQVPIWKEQYFADGSVEWVGAGGASDSA